MRRTHTPLYLTEMVNQLMMYKKDHHHSPLLTLIRQKLRALSEMKNLSYTEKVKIFKICGHLKHYKHFLQYIKQYNSKNVQGNLSFSRIVYVFLTWAHAI